MRARGGRAALSGRRGAAGPRRARRRRVSSEFCPALGAAGAGARARTLDGPRDPRPQAPVALTAAPAPSRRR